MRIHTDLTITEMHAALRESGAPIAFESISEHRSKTHKRAFEVRLTGTGGRSNTGLYGAGNYSGATWDEWGAFFGSLYNRDPEARSGGSVKNPVYANAADYHQKTGDRFRRRSDNGSFLPADTHPRHRWEYLWGAGFQCSKCSAWRPPNVPRTYDTGESYVPQSEEEDRETCGHGTWLATCQEPHGVIRGSLASSPA